MTVTNWICSVGNCLVPLVHWAIVNKKLKKKKKRGPSGFLTCVLRSVNMFHVTLHLPTMYWYKPHVLCDYQCLCVFLHVHARVRDLATSIQNHESDPNSTWSVCAMTVKLPSGQVNAGRVMLALAKCYIQITLTSLFHQNHLLMVE